MKRPNEMAERLKDGDTDAKFCREVLAYVETLESAYRAACASSDSYKAALHENT